MAIYFFSGGAGGNNCKLLWSGEHDDAAQTVKLTVTHTHFDGSACPMPVQAQITVQLNSGQPFAIDLQTDGGLFDGGPANMLNAGEQTKSNIRLKVGAGRSAVIAISTQYQPPA
jgi:hypothetical protein